MNEQSTFRLLLSRSLALLFDRSTSHTASAHLVVIPDHQTSSHATIAKHADVPRSHIPDIELEPQPIPTNNRSVRAQTAPGQTGSKSKDVMEFQLVHGREFEFEFEVEFEYECKEGWE